MKFCLCCRGYKSFGDFPKDTRRKDGRFTYCKLCHRAMQSARRMANPEKVIEQNQKTLKQRHELKAANPQDYRDRWWIPYLKRNYGLTKAQFDQLFEIQKGACAICKNLFSMKRRCYIDHKPGSNPIIVRGLLCLECNTGLGKFGDSSNLLKVALEYVSFYE